MSHAEIYDRAKTLEDILMPKIIYLRESGDGAIIHEIVCSMQNVLNKRFAYEQVLKGNIDGDLDVLAKEYLSKIEKTEKWLVWYAKKL